jgi:hypothetical protein
LNNGEKMRDLLQSQFKDITFHSELFGNPITSGTEATARGTNIANDPRLPAILNNFKTNLTSIFNDPPYAVDYVVLSPDEIIIYMA